MEFTYTLTIDRKDIASKIYDVACAYENKYRVKPKLLLLDVFSYEYLKSTDITLYFRKERVHMFDGMKIIPIQTTSELIFAQTDMDCVMLELTKKDYVSEVESALKTIR